MFRSVSWSITCAIIRAVGSAIGAWPRRNRRLCILSYHRVLRAPDPLLDSEPDLTTFAWQMRLLSECFNVLPLREGIERLKKGTLPARAVCITFDDGYRSIHDLALPILRDFHLPATVFVTSSYLYKDDMWNDRILDAMRQVPDGVLDLEDHGLGQYDISTLEDRKRATDSLIAKAKYLPPAARSRVPQLLETLVPTNKAERQMLTPEMVRTLASEGIDIGGHTVTHPILTNLDDDSAWMEIHQNKTELESITGREVWCFAYPNGKYGTDFDDRHISMVKRAGYECAFTTKSGAAGPDADVFQIPRGRPWDLRPAAYGFRMLRWLASGMFSATGRSC